MEIKETTLREWIVKFDNHEFDLPFRDIQIKAGWFDWFCDDKSLVGKTMRLGKKVKQIAKSKKINLDTSYVFFKNNCPCAGPLYDSFSICNIENGDVLYWITPKSGHSGKAEVYGEGYFKEALAEGKWKDITTFFGV